MEEPKVDEGLDELDKVEKDYTLRLDELALEGVGVLRQIMTDEDENPSLRATVARVVIDLAHREEVWKTKGKPKASGESQ